MCIDEVPDPFRQWVITYHAKMIAIVYEFYLETESFIVVLY